MGNQGEHQKNIAENLSAFFWCSLFLFSSFETTELRRFAPLFSQAELGRTRSRRKGWRFCAHPLHIGRQCRPNLRGFERFRELLRVALKFAKTLLFENNAGGGAKKSDLSRKTKKKAALAIAS